MRLIQVFLKQNKAEKVRQLLESLKSTDAKLATELVEMHQEALLGALGQEFVVKSEIKISA